MPSAELPSEASTKRVVKPWRVLHACEKSSIVRALIDAESSVGMNPQVLSREFWNHQTQNVSLLTTWNDVRDWRRALNDVEAGNSFQIVHAHSFASAMAGVRGTLPLVYDFSCTLDEVSPEQPHPGPWLLRSFRVAEQFALSRAGAVVTHSKAMAKIAHQRGAAKLNIFRIHPAFVPSNNALHHHWAETQNIDRRCEFVILALATVEGFELPLRAFATLACELPRALFMLECHDGEREAIFRLAREFNIAASVRCVSSADLENAIASADVVVACPTGDRGTRSNPGMLAAMSDAKPVLAADVPENRECSEDGAGCLWFHEDDLTNLTQRMLFLARNKDLCRELGQAGNQHLMTTRAPEVVAQAYDEVYRHAQSRRTETITLLPAPKIYALGPV